MSDAQIRLDDADVRGAQEPIHDGHRRRVDAIWAYEQLSRAERADETPERTFLDPIEERVHGGEERGWTRALEAIDKRRGVGQEPATRAPDRRYEPVLSRHGPRSSST